MTESRWPTSRAFGLCRFLACPSRAVRLWLPLNGIKRVVTAFLWPVKPAFSTWQPNPQIYA